MLVMTTKLEWKKSIKSSILSAGLVVYVSAAFPTEIEMESVSSFARYAIRGSQAHLKKADEDMMNTLTDANKIQTLTKLMKF